MSGDALSQVGVQEVCSRACQGARAAEKMGALDDALGDATQCPRCDRVLHHPRLKHCTAKDRSPAGTNKREQGACARRASSPALIRLAEPMIARLRSCAARKVKRAFKAAVKKAKQAFHDGIDSWMRRLAPVGTLVDARASVPPRYRGSTRNRGSVRVPRLGKPPELCTEPRDRGSVLWTTEAR